MILFNQNDHFVNLGLPLYLAAVSVLFSELSGEHTFKRIGQQLPPAPVAKRLRQ
jgi:hypothetical protein